LQLTLNAKAARKIGFPLSKELVERELIIAQGTITGAQKSFDTKSFTLQAGLIMLTQLMVKPLFT
jgi:hypothetical protein